MKYLLPDLDSLITELQRSGYCVLGPTEGEAAITIKEIQSAKDLPAGVLDKQAPGQYRLEKTSSKSVFAHVVGPESWKPYFFAKEEVLFYSEAQDDGVVFRSAQIESTKRAFLGMRSCDLHAIAIQDKVFSGRGNSDTQFADSHYSARRKNTLFIAVNCVRSGEMCFCSSLDTGPFVNTAFDLLLTEIELQDSYYFLLEAGSDPGRTIVDTLKLKVADSEQTSICESLQQRASQQQKRLPTENLKDNITSMLGNEPFWQELANRCLACANCTLVCPTCFCSDTVEQSDLSGQQAARVRIWDSCFNSGHSHMAGGEHREQRFSRYRQWFSHKLSSWYDQFDSSGCTGCGRCITWCPVGIDITVEADRLQQAVKVQQ